MSAESLKAIDDAVTAHNAALNDKAGEAPDWDHVTGWAIIFECKRFGNDDDGNPVVMHTNQYAIAPNTSPNASVGLLSWGLSAVEEDTSGGSSYMPE
jgi:hypothetical protein